MIINDESFNQKKAEAEVFYKSVEQVSCPYFEGARVFFNAEGFEHLVFKGWDRTRSREDQYHRFRLLPLVVRIIKRSGTLQEYDEKMVFVRRQSRGTWHKVMKLVRYYVFVAIVNDLRMKVVIKEVEGGQKNFHSVYPSWATQSDGNGGIRRKLFTGDLEND